MSYVTGATGVIRIGGALLQGRADRMSANTNAMEDDFQAQQVQEAAQQQAAIIQRAGQYATARATAAYAASGVVVGNGSAEQAASKITTDSTHDAYMTILTGDKRAIALKAQAAIGQAAASGQAGAAIGGAISSTALAVGNQAYSQRSGWATAGGNTSSFSGARWTGSDGGNLNGAIG